ncbi:MAG TPA: carbohydrate porin [Candidatus Binataceae bacterium]|nr:carbohydrate porin [Candidatus Binataceae bacterium]
MSRSLRRQAAVLLGALALLALSAWLALASLAAAIDRSVLGLGALCFLFGLRHGFDADHIAAIDNVTRKLRQDGKRSLTIGVFFALGHSATVMLLCLLMIAAGHSRVGHEVLTRLSGSSLSRLASAGFLTILGAINVAIFVQLRQLASATGAQADGWNRELESLLNQRGIIGRIFATLYRRISASWQMLVVGFLFGLGFDTATEVAVLGFSGEAASHGTLPLWAIMIFPVMFTAGMALVDGMDGAFMMGMYDWAFSDPARKLSFNLTVTGVSAGVALGVALAEWIQFAASRLGGLRTLAEKLDSSSLGLIVTLILLAAWSSAGLLYSRRRKASPTAPSGTNGPEFPGGLPRQFTQPHTDTAPDRQAFGPLLLLCSALLGASTGNCLASEGEQIWNWHVQGVVVGQGDPSFRAKYSGPQSLDNAGQAQETFGFDFFGGLRLWSGAEAHVDGLMWQGFGLSDTHGIEAFPNGEAFKAGTQTPNLTFARLFLRQTIGLGGQREQVRDGLLTLAGEQDVCRLTFTVGRFTPLDVMDHNVYAQDPGTQFMNWAMMGNLAWDYGQDTIGYTTGAAMELNQPKWALRYVFFTMPPYHNLQNVGSGDSGDDQYLMWPARGSYGPFLRSWAMATEVERRYGINAHPGAIRLLAWLDEANMASYLGAAAILRANGANANISPAQGYHYKYGFGLNWQQEIMHHVGMFSRLGWNDGRCQALEYTDVNWTASLGVSVAGEMWRRPGDCFGLAGVISGASSENQKFLAAGGLGILDGDGALNYGSEKVVETFYSLRIWRNVQLTVDYQLVANPAFNQARGPVSVLGTRLYFEV